MHIWIYHFNVKMKHPAQSQVTFPSPIHEYQSISWIQCFRIRIDPQANRCTQKFGMSPFTQRWQPQRWLGRRLSCYFRVLGWKTLNDDKTLITKHIKKHDGLISRSNEESLNEDIECRYSKPETEWYNSAPKYTMNEQTPNDTLGKTIGVF